MSYALSIKMAILVQWLSMAEIESKQSPSRISLQPWHPRQGKEAVVFILCISSKFILRCCHGRLRFCKAYKLKHGFEPHALATYFVEQSGKRLAGGYHRKENVEGDTHTFAFDAVHGYPKDPEWHKFLDTFHLWQKSKGGTPSITQSFRIEHQDLEWGSKAVCGTPSPRFTNAYLQQFFDAKKDSNLWRIIGKGKRGFSLVVSKIHREDSVGPIVLTRNNGKTRNGANEGTTKIFTKIRLSKKNYKFIMENLEVGVWKLRACYFMFIATN